MRWRGIIVCVIWLAWAVPAWAQLRTSLPSFGAQPEAPPSDSLGLTDNFAGLIEGAAPMSHMRLRFDSTWRNRRPNSAEFLTAKPGILGGRGMPLIETNVDYQELTTYGEMAWSPWYSTFLEIPIRWMNPEVNQNTVGYGSTRFGMKLVTWNDERFIATILLRLSSNGGDRGGLSNGHWTFEPGLLAAYQFWDFFRLEGEFRYWIPLNNNGFSGEILQYGLALSYGQKEDGFWWMPVVEAQGSTVLAGQEVVASTPTLFEIRSAADSTLLYGQAGVRFGWGPNLDFYAGYNRALTGDRWHRDAARLEMRFKY